MGRKLSYNKIGTIIKHEYLSKLKTKGFLLGTLLGPLALVLFFGIVIAVTVMTMGETSRKIAILDKSEYEIGKQIVDMDSSRYYLTDIKEIKLKKMTLDEEIDGFLSIPANILQEGHSKVFSRGGGGLGFIENMKSKLHRVVRRERMELAGADKEMISLVEQGVSLDMQKITEEGTQKDYTEAYTAIGYIMAFAIYILMLIYGSFVSRGVIEEKSNRIIEVLASSAKPFEIMFGKVVGIGALGLTQVIFWMLLSVILMTAAGPIMSHFVSDPQQIQQVAGGGMAPGMNVNTDGQEIMEVMGVFTNLSPWLAVAFLFYFTAGYFLYATLFAGIGASVDQEQDAAQLQMPVTMLVIIPMLFISAVMSDPDGTLAIVLSLVPFFSPIIMMLRIAATEVPLWQIATSVVLMLSTFLGALWVAAKIYRIGFLMTGNKPSFKDIFRWLRAD